VTQNKTSVETEEMVNATTTH